MAQFWRHCRLTNNISHISWNIFVAFTWPCKEVSLWISNEKEIIPLKFQSSLLSYITLPAFTSGLFLCATYLHDIWEIIYIGCWRTSSSHQPRVEGTTKEYSLAQHVTLIANLGNLTDNIQTRRSINNWSTIKASRLVSKWIEQYVFHLYYY